MIKHAQFRNLSHTVAANHKAGKLRVFPPYSGLEIELAKDVFARLIDCLQSLFGQLTGQAYHASERKNQNQLGEIGASKRAEGNLGNGARRPCFGIALNLTDIKRLLEVYKIDDSCLRFCLLDRHVQLDWHGTQHSNVRG